VTEKITIDIDQQKFAELMAIFKRIADAAELMVGVEDSDGNTSTQPRSQRWVEKRPAVNAKSDTTPLRDRRGKKKDD
jgi:hypothetical protein